LQVVGLDQTDAGGIVLSAEDGGAIPGGEALPDGRFAIVGRQKADLFQFAMRLAPSAVAIASYVPERRAGLFPLVATLRATCG